MKCMIPFIEKRQLVKFSNRTLIKMLVLLAVLNTVDAFSTLYFVSNGYAKELNPLMAMCLEMGVLPFLFVKLFLVSLGIGFLWHAKEYKLVHRITVALMVLYIIIVCIHVEIAWNVIYFSTLQF